MLVALIPATPSVVKPPAPTSIPTMGAAITTADPIALTVTTFWTGPVRRDKLFAMQTVRSVSSDSSTSNYITVIIHHRSINVAVLNNETLLLEFLLIPFKFRIAVRFMTAPVPNDLDV
jgi:hypothetical protein